jgi:hypothetical protein
MQAFSEGNNRTMEERVRELLAVSHSEIFKIEVHPDKNDVNAECGSTTQETLAGELHGPSSIANLRRTFNTSQTAASELGLLGGISQSKPDIRARMRRTH